MGARVFSGNAHRDALSRAEPAETTVGYQIHLNHADFIGDAEGVAGIRTVFDTKLYDEPARIAALGRYEILDTRPEGPFDRITELVKTALDVPMAAVSLIDKDRQWFKSHPGIEACETARDISFCQHTIRARQPMIVADARADERFRDNPLVTGDPHIGSYAGVPLVSPDGYNIGSLCAIDRRPRNFAASQLSILTGLAGLVVDQLELRRIAEYDHLSGALSRRTFIGELEKAIALFHRRGRSASLVLFDIDHFKSINDRFGHPIGDRVIRTIADYIGSTARASDAFGRLGGEEFGLLLFDTSLDQARQAAERYRGGIASLIIGHDEPFAVTVSGGLAALSQQCASPDAWLACADKALYAAKHYGRDQVRMFEAA